MPVFYQIDRTQRVIRTKCVGDVTLDEVLGHFGALEQDPRCPNHLDVLLDLCETTSMPKAEQLKAVSNEIGRIRKRVRFDACAIAVSRDALYGMARMFEVLAEDRFRETHVFRTLDEAEKWLEAKRGSSVPAPRHGLTGS